MPQRVIHGIDELRALIGEEVGVSDWLLIDQRTIDQFAAITHDPQWIHIDEDRCRRESPYGSTIAHGFLTLSLLSFFSSQAVTVEAPVRNRINYGLNRVRFTGPVPAGSRVRGRFTLQSVKDIQDGVEMIYSVIVEREGEKKPALIAEWVTRLNF